MHRSREGPKSSSFTVMQKESVSRRAAWAASWPTAGPGVWEEVERVVLWHRVISQTPALITSNSPCSNQKIRSKGGFFVGVWYTWQNSFLFIIWRYKLLLIHFFLFQQRRKWEWEKVKFLKKTGRKRTF